VVELLTVVAIFGIRDHSGAVVLSLIASKRAESTATDLFVALVDAQRTTKRNASATLAPKSGGWQTAGR
jgi:hypothetical protein